MGGFKPPWRTKHSRYAFGSCFAKRFENPLLENPLFENPLLENPLLEKVEQKGGLWGLCPRVEEKGGF